MHLKVLEKLMQFNLICENCGSEEIASYNMIKIVSEEERGVNPPTHSN